MKGLGAMAEAFISLALTLPHRGGQDPTDAERASAFRPRQVHVRRAVDDRPVPVEPRAVARAVPGLLGRVPLDDAAQVRADRRALVQRAVLVAVDGHLVQAPCGSPPPAPAGSRGPTSRRRR